MTKHEFGVNLAEDLKLVIKWHGSRSGLNDLLDPPEKQTLAIRQVMNALQTTERVNNV